MTMSYRKAVFNLPKSQRTESHRWLPLRALLALSIAALAFWACGKNRSSDPDVISRSADKKPLLKKSPGDKNQKTDLESTAEVKKRECKTPETSVQLPAIQEEANPGFKSVSFESLRSKVETTCAKCHGAPLAAKGGFSFALQHKNKSFAIAGEATEFLGIEQSADTIENALRGANGISQMPPGSKSSDPDILELLNLMAAWKQAGKPEGSFWVPTDGTQVFNSTPDTGTEASGLKAGQFVKTDLGDCIPKAEVVGVDPQRDALFASWNELPKLLSQTDLFSGDDLELAKAGTVAYNVEYPLWADNSEKGRYIHLPSDKNDQDKWVRKTPQLLNGDYVFPENTRFYKTFYKAVTNADGSKVFRKIETRIIVVRKDLKSNLMGTYLWNEKESEAVLHDKPYRDGTGFRDEVLFYQSDVPNKKARKYALPGMQRCVECHNGTPQSVLGFTPTQLTRRALGEAGRDLPVGADESNQVERLVSYSVLPTQAVPDEATKLENARNDRGEGPRNVHELRLQGFMVGNCSHCHNPEGFAMKENQVKFEMTAGKLFQFDSKNQRSIHFARSSNKLFVNLNQLSPDNITLEDLRQSYLFLRVQAGSKDKDLLPFNAMPMHTPGGTNCKLINLTGKWILSQLPNGEELADKWSYACDAVEDYPWIALDSTESPNWTPRRLDWATAMPDLFRNMEFPEGLQTIANYKFPLGYFTAKPECVFPADFNPPKVSDPYFWQDWMWKTGVPNTELRKPLNELYFVKPGAYFYSSMCAKCHGNLGNGQGPFATSLNVLSDGDIRVANFMSGLFAPQGKNLSQFDVTEPSGEKRNLSANYLIWMAMGGTLVNFPDSVSEITGKHKANMLNLARDICSGFLPGSPKAVGPFFYNYGLLKAVCFYNNGDPTNVPADLGFDKDTVPPLPINEEKQNVWLDKAAINAGYTIYRYLKDDAMNSVWQPGVNECEKVYPTVR